MSPEALASFSAIMLAQAQECIFLKAEKGTKLLLTLFLLAYFILITFLQTT